MEDSTEKPRPAPPVAYDSTAGCENGRLHPEVLVAYDSRVALHPPQDLDIQQRISAQACGIARALLGVAKHYGSAMPR